MRKALNENPRVQMIVIGGMLVVGVVLLFTTVLKKDEPVAGPTTSSVPGDPAATAASPSAATPPVSGDPSIAPTGTTTPAPAPDPAASAAADGLLPTKGLPKDVLIAFAKDKAIAILVVDPDSVADERVEDYSDLISSRDDVELFVVDVKDIAKYSRITSGVAVSRAPALVVIRPRKLTNNVPTATVSYGFQSERTVEQALDDALYEGPQISASP